MSLVDQTKQKFKYQNTVIKDYKYWHLLLWNQQVTACSMVLICSEDVGEFNLISSEAHKELKEIITEIETKLKSEFNFKKINYMMYMMVDPAVHFHIIPRYSQDITLDNIEFKDTGWPFLPDLSYINELTESQFNQLKNKVTKILK
jgi:diadenosine tetraphosphate (Ap4A) HIT family hydrolase